jgi:hypothetical protein
MPDMDRDQLQQHPAYLALTVDERAAIDERLGAWQLDTQAVGALTGGLDELEASDLRFWLASTATRPWMMVSICKQPAEADAIFQALLAAAPELSERDDRVELVELASELSRALLVAERARVDEGFVREEQLGALAVRLDELESRVRSWDDEVVLQVLREHDLAELAQELVGYAREHRGLRGLFKRLGERVQNSALDLVHGTLFVATGAADHEGHYRHGTWRNWTANYEASPASFVRPASEIELCAAVAQARKVRMVGGGHSFNDGTLCSDRMISLDAYDRIIEVDAVAKTARVQGGIRLRDLNRALWNCGLGLPVLGSTDAQSIAGLVSTDLHGTGRDHGFLSEQILSLRIIGGNGEARTVRPGDPLFHAAIGAIGTCGVIAEVELQLVDSFRLEKRTAMVDRYESEDSIDSVLADNEHVSFYYIGGSNESAAVRMHRWNRTQAELTPDWEQHATKVELSDFAISAYASRFARALADVARDVDYVIDERGGRGVLGQDRVGLGRERDRLRVVVGVEGCASRLGSKLDLAALSVEQLGRDLAVIGAQAQRSGVLGRGGVVVGRRHELVALLDVALPGAAEHQGQGQQQRGREA